MLRINYFLRFLPFKSSLRYVWLIPGIPSIIVCATLFRSSSLNSVPIIGSAYGSTIIPPCSRNDSGYNDLSQLEVPPMRESNSFSQESPFGDIKSNFDISSDDLPF